MEPCGRIYYFNVS